LIELFSLELMLSFGGIIPQSDKTFSLLVFNASKSKSDELSLLSKLLGT